MDIEEHHKAFLKIIEKYHLKDHADRLADYITHSDNSSIDRFSKEFDVPIDEATMFISFIEKGLSFKENLKS